MQLGGQRPDRKAEWRPSRGKAAQGQEASSGWRTEAADGRDPTGMAKVEWGWGEGNRARKSWLGRVNRNPGPAEEGSRARGRKEATFGGGRDQETAGENGRLQEAPRTPQLGPSVAGEGCECLLGSPRQHDGPRAPRVIAQGPPRSHYAKDYSN